MKRFFLVVMLSAFAVGSAVAQETCESKAISKDGKPVGGRPQAHLPKEGQAGRRRGKGGERGGKKFAGRGKKKFKEEVPGRRWGGRTPSGGDQWWFRPGPPPPFPPAGAPATSR